MSTDRELLELAARAIALKNHGYVRENYPNREGILHGDLDGRLFVWNPLGDDGDALRLAVKMNMRVRIQMFASGITIADSSKSKEQKAERHGDDACAATRRAIVRAAAALGATT